MTRTKMERRIRLAAVLTVLGLMIQGAALIPIHPLAFVTFVAIGCPLSAGGILLFLIALLARDQSPEMRGDFRQRSRPS